MRRGLERQLRGEIGTLTAERDQARRDLERVMAQRDELRRTIESVRGYVRQEVLAHVHPPPSLFPDGSVREQGLAVMRPTVALAAHLSDPEPPTGDPQLPDWIWPDPNGRGWVDAWNGWYPTEKEAREHSASAVGNPWVLCHGEGLVDTEEMERRAVRR